MKPLRPSPPTTPPPMGPVPKVEYDANENVEESAKVDLPWAQGDLLRHITTGTGRSLLEALNENESFF